MLLPLSPLRIGWALAALRVDVHRTCTGEAEALVSSTYFENQPGPGSGSDALMVLHQEAHGNREKGGKQKHIVCLSLLNHQAGGGPSHTIQLSQLCGSLAVRSAFRLD